MENVKQTEFALFVSAGVIAPLFIHPDILGPLVHLHDKPADSKEQAEAQANR